MIVRSIEIADAMEVHALTRRWEMFWEAPLVTPLHEIEDELETPHIALATDTRGYWLDGKLIAYGRIWHRPGGVGHERAYVQGFVDPSHRGVGIGRDLLSWQIARATEILRDMDDQLPKYIRADEWDWIEENHRLYRRFGLEPVRYFTEMLKRLDEPSPVPSIPDVEIIPYDRGLDSKARDAINRAFQDHWGSTPTDEASFEHRLKGQGMRLDTSYLATAGGEVIGVVLNSHYPEDEELLGRRDGWVETLGVVREWRRKGVATALLQASFNAFVERGFTHSAIGVDTASPTDAFKLYSNMGYEPTHRTITHQIEIDSHS
jgi:GNAT superfamily N-acetyltransferase